MHWAKIKRKLQNKYKLKKNSTYPETEIKPKHNSCKTKYIK